ncbi:MAG: Yip1 family protein [Pseudomonadales bacterium]
MKTLIYGLLVTLNPAGGWQKIADNGASLATLLLLHTVPYALIPAICWYYGVTSAGWTVAGEVYRLTPASALPMCAMFFVAMVAGVVFLGYMVKWMSQSYGTESTLAKGATLISYTASPFFLAGLLGLHPVMWLDILVGCLVACYCIFLLYRGTPVVMGVAPERGFLYASAVFAVALVSFVALLGATVVLWTSARRRNTPTERPRRRGAPAPRPLTRESPCGDVGEVDQQQQHTPDPADDAAPDQGDGYQQRRQQQPEA